MAVRINGKEIDTCEGLTLGKFLRDKEIAVEKIVVEYNLNVLSREFFDSTLIKNGDNIEILSFVGGG
jgi:sulfur carrier protein